MGDNPCVSLLGKELLVNLSMAGVSLKAKSIILKKWKDRWTTCDLEELEVKRLGGLVGTD